VRTPRLWREMRRRATEIPPEHRHIPKINGQLPERAHGRPEGTQAHAVSERFRRCSGLDCADSKAAPSPGGRHCLTQDPGKKPPVTSRPRRFHRGAQLLAACACRHRRLRPAACEASALPLTSAARRSVPCRHSPRVASERQAGRPLMGVLFGGDGSLVEAYEAASHLQPPDGEASNVRELRRSA